ncbi:HAMP domain-containing histidine kinase [Nocardioides sp. ChNu-153]|uniref:sensor histidine kinase n=1 Tax=unclassified Nocardioides TaxID=2615069 RepID=UPI002405F99D|nr:MULTISPECIES: HAMP domain-containing sensor histidine kinase [unclassified Nocardioides]MDF9715531.1 HAMP domain-containing histidine kinase [Nocardioides sp. ChNu-99]MDN7120714.1 HAMP domain-containing histidine kinase [Nocardioides sp. ChNu-153]
MRRRLLALSLSVTVAVLAALVVPLVAAYAEQRAVRLHEERLAAATRFATLAGAPGIDSDPALLAADLERYDAVTTTTRTFVLDADGSVLAPAGTTLPADVAGLDDAVRDALAGTPTSPPEPLWPWNDDPVVVATPIGRDAQVLGAVLLVEQTDDQRRAVATRMALAAGAGALFVAALAWLVGVPLVGWVVRPVEELDERARDLARGRTPPAGRIEGPPELRRLVESFNAMAASVEHSQRQQRELVADVSHQLANPLTALRLRLEGIGTDDPAVEAVLAETDRLARALDAVIEVSRAGGFDRVAVRVDAAAQVRERIELWAPLFGDRLVARVPDGPLPAVLEEDLLATVLDALLDNALKYAADAAVEVDLHRDPGHVVLVVRDHGPGVDDAEAAALGHRFRRLERHADVEGTGLGLAIVLLRAQDAGGRADVEAAHPGLRVRLRLPVGPVRGTTAASPGGAAPAG